MSPVMIGKRVLPVGMLASSTQTPKPEHITDIHEFESRRLERVAALFKIAPAFFGWWVDAAGFQWSWKWRGR